MLKLSLRQKIADLPQALGESRCHGRRHSECAGNPAENSADYVPLPPQAVGSNRARDLGEGQTGNSLAPCVCRHTLTLNFQKFVTDQRGGNLTTQAFQVNTAISSCIFLASLLRVLRHTVAMTLLLNGCPIGHIKELLGHERLDTTCRYYLGVDLRAAKEAHRKFLRYE